MIEEETKEKARKAPPYGLLQEYSPFSPRIFLVMIEDEEEGEESPREDER